jgi:hypothetical protein
MKIDWNKVYTFVIDIKTLNKARDIHQIFKKRGIVNYVYMIKCNGIVVKYGLSVDKNSDHGERIYRQIGHAKFWAARRLDGDSGRDFRRVEELFTDQYGIEITQNNLTVEVWDFTNYPFMTTEKEKEIENAEQELINTYMKITGKAPVGNLSVKKNYNRRGFVMTDHLDTLFDS